MADITMCQDRECPMRKTCRRSAESGTPITSFTRPNGIVEDHQSYFAKSPRVREDCNYYSPVRERQRNLNTAEWPKDDA